MANAYSESKILSIEVRLKIKGCPNEAMAFEAMSRVAKVESQSGLDHNTFC